MKGTQHLREVEGVDEAFHIKAALVRILSDHGVNVTRSTLEDLTGYIIKVAGELNPYEPSAIDFYAGIAAKEIWDEPVGPHHDRASRIRRR